MSVNFYLATKSSLKRRYKHFSEIGDSSLSSVTKSLEKIAILCCISLNSIFFPGNSSALLVLCKKVFLTPPNNLLLFSHRTWLSRQWLSWWWSIPSLCCVQPRAANTHPGFPNHNCCCWLRRHKAQRLSAHLLLTAFLLGPLKEWSAAPGWGEAVESCSSFSLLPGVLEEESGTGSQRGGSSA